MMHWLYLRFRGYVYVCFSGRNARRCMNLCVRRNLSIWGIRAEDEDHFSFYMYADEVACCKPFLKKTHTRLQIKKRYGLPFFLFHYRKRILFPAAFLLSALLLFYYSGFVWKIEIVGNSSITEDTMIGYLQKKGAGFGDKKGQIDCPALELSLRREFEQVIWASVYIKGTKLVVELQENLQKEVVSKPAETEKSLSSSDSCYDLTATKDAEITSMITRSGTPCVMPGQQVKKGDLLVSGCQEIRNDSGDIAQYYYQSADADVYGIVSYDYTASIPVSRKVELENGKTKSCFFLQWDDWIFESPLLFSKYKNSHISEDYYQLHIAPDFYLPIFAGRKTYHSYETVTEQIDTKEAKAEAQKELNDFLKDLEENGVQILSKNVRMKHGKNTYTITGEIKACESIIKKVPTVPKDTEIKSNQEGTAQDEHE